MEVNPVFVFKHDLKRHVVNGIELLPRTVQRNFDAYARVFELIFETITIDFHLAQSHDGFIVKSVVLRLDLATVFDWLILRLETTVPHSSPKQAGCSSYRFSKCSVNCRG